MALSMEEQRILAEIEQRLAKEEPGMAARLASFGNTFGTGRIRARWHKLPTQWRRVILVAAGLLVAALIVSGLVVLIKTSGTPYQATHRDQPLSHRIGSQFSHNRTSIQFEPDKPSPTSNAQAEPKG